MTILKLANAGDEATLEITGCAYVEGQYGPKVLFEAGADSLYLPQTSADRQLDRIGLLDGDKDPEDAYHRVPGNTLIFSRAPSTKPGGKPFWNINTAKPNGKPAKPPVQYAANKPQSELPPLLRNAEAEDAAELASKIGVDLSGIQKQLAVYQAVAEWAVKTLPPIFGTGSDAVGMTPESLAACTNTIYINAAKK